MPNAKTTKPAPKSASPKQGSVVPVDIFGPPSLLEGEDGAAYAGLLERVQEAVKPRDVIEQIAMRDFVDITWQIFRLRRLRRSLPFRGDLLRQRQSDLLDRS